MEVVLEAGHTHFYPGHEGWLEGDAPSAPAGPGGVPSRIAFAGGVMAGGTLFPSADGGWELEVAPYATAAGTDIAAKRWRIAFHRVAGGRTRFRIERKLVPRKG